MTSGLHTIQHNYTVRMSCEEHQQALSKLCRVCGNLLGKAKARNISTYLCSDFKQHLVETFDIHTDSDSPDSHPQRFCRACYDVIKGKEKAVVGVAVYKPQVQVFNQWCHHHDHYCAVCDHFGKLSIGGRPKKVKRVGRPATVSFRSAIKHIRSIAPPTLLPDGVKHIEAVSPKSSNLSELKCALCDDLVNQPVELSSCRKLACSECLAQKIEATESLNCPVCSQNHLENFTTIREASSLVLNVLKELPIKCQSCSSQVSLGEYTAHLRSSCNQHTAEVITVEDVLMRPMDSPLQPAEQQLQASLARRSMATSPDDSILRVKTGGQVIFY